MITMLHDSGTAWTVDRDEVFFRVVQGIFGSAWLEAASTLLAGYDPDERAEA